MKKFESGQTVKLKSGSPVLTINKINQTGDEAECVWCDGNKMCRERFNIEALEAFERDKNIL